MFFKKRKSNLEFGLGTTDNWKSWICLFSFDDQGGNRRHSKSLRLNVPQKSDQVRSLQVISRQVTLY